MPARFGAEFRFGLQGQGSGLQREDVPTLRIAVLADLCGRAGREAEDLRVPIAQRRFVGADVDNFDQVLARIEPRLQLGVGDPDSPRLPLVFRSLDHFHPDALYRGLELFGPLRDVRRRLLDASTFAAAAAEWSPAVGLAVASGPEGSGRAVAQAEDDEAVRRRLLGRGSADIAPVSPAQARLDRLLREIVAAHVVPSPDPRLPELLRSVAETAAALLRAILHHRSFQALRGVWRSVCDLVMRIPRSRRASSLRHCAQYDRGSLNGVPGALS